MNYEVYLSTLDNTSSDIIENATDPRDALLFAALDYVDSAKRDFSFSGYRFDIKDRRRYGNGIGRLELALTFFDFEGGDDTENDPDPLIFYVDL